MKCPHCGLINPETAQRCDCGYDFDEREAPAETEPISVVNRRWLWAARCSALIPLLITLGLAFAAAPAEVHWRSAPGGGSPGHFVIMPEDTIEAGAGWWVLNVTLLWLLFRKGKNPLAFALGMGVVIGFLVSLGGVLMFNFSRLKLGLFALLTISIVVPGPLFYLMFPELQTLNWLVWPLCISSLMLGASSLVSFTKMRHEANGTGRRRSAFGIGMFCGFAGYVLSSAIGVAFAGLYALGGLR